MRTTALALVQNPDFEVDVTTVAHPTLVGVRMRAGRNKLGHWMMYEPTFSRGAPQDEWREGRACTEDEIDAICSLFDASLASFHRGPAGACLVYRS